MDEKRELLRHTLAAVAYRAARALDGAPGSFANFDLAAKPPIAILAHMSDVLDWGLSAAIGNETWHSSNPLPWAAEKTRFFASLGAFDTFLASGEALQAPIDRLMQGPVADVLTHIGQIAMLRRLAGSPTVGENFYIAEIVVGRVSPDQPAPLQPFK
jgi:hypothetical protein